MEKIFLNRNNSRQGFTLVELMIVVAIIGILAAVAIPNYLKYQAKARQAEAKIQLASVFTAEKSVYAEYSSHHACLNAAGFAPDSATRYYSVGFNTAFAATNMPACAAQTTNNINTTTAVTCWGSTAIQNTGSTQNTPCDGATVIAFINTDNFNAIATGNITRSSSALFDVWRIRETKQLDNPTSGI